MFGSSEGRWKSQYRLLKAGNKRWERDLKVGIVKQLDQYQPWTNLSSQILPSPFTVFSNVVFAGSEAKAEHSSLWIVTRGSVEVAESGQLLALLETGATFGDSVALDVVTSNPSQTLGSVFGWVFYLAKVCNFFNEKCCTFVEELLKYAVVLSCCCWGKGLWGPTRCMVFACSWTTTSFEITSCSCQHHGWVCGSTRETCDLASSIKDKFVVSHWSQLY